MSEQHIANDQIRDTIDIPSRDQESFWAKYGGAISEQTKQQNMNNAMTKLSRLKEDSSFSQFYDSLSKDEQSYLGILMIAEEDLMTMAELGEYAA